MRNTRNPQIVLEQSLRWNEYVQKMRIKSHFKDTFVLKVIGWECHDSRLRDEQLNQPPGLKLGNSFLLRLSEEWNSLRVQGTNQDIQTRTNLEKLESQIDSAATVLNAEPPSFFFTEIPGLELGNLLFYEYQSNSLRSLTRNTRSRTI